MLSVKFTLDRMPPAPQQAKHRQMKSIYPRLVHSLQFYCLKASTWDHSFSYSYLQPFPTYPADLHTGRRNLPFTLPALEPEQT